MSFELQQDGYNLRGFLNTEAPHYTSAGVPQESYTNFYKVRGTVANNIARIEIAPISKKRTGFGYFLLEVKNGGYEMNGKCVFLAEKTNKIGTDDTVSLERIDKNS
jgi:hypothetical protein